MIEGQEGVTWDDWVALASACEEHGVEALFRSDHYISWFDENRRVLDAWASLAGLAARTSKLELGTLVSPAKFRYPSVLARSAVRFAHEYNALFGTLDDARERKQLLDNACEHGDRDLSTLRYALVAP